MHALLEQYTHILGRMKREDFSMAEDRYSGVFLPIAFADYWTSDFRIMHVGRETAGWNTRTGLNRLERIFAANESGATRGIVDEAVARYRQHFQRRPDGKITTTTTSRFKQYYFRIAKELDLTPASLIYANLFAWDFAGKSPLERAPEELAAVSQVSLTLLATQIRWFKPNAIVFSTGRTGIDFRLKQLFETHFDGYQTVNREPGKLWEFKVGAMTCFRIAHPRAMRGHQQYRADVIGRLKDIRAGRS